MKQVMSMITQQALRKRQLSARDLAKMLDCTEQHALDLLDDYVYPTARELAVMRLCANVVAKRLRVILREMEADYEWKRIPGFDKYEASERGQIRRATAGHGSMPGHVLRPKVNKKTGHLSVRIAPDGGGKVRSMLVHRAVCLAFHGPQPTPAHMTCHENDVPGENHASNLYWGTSQQNANDRIRNAYAKNSDTKLTRGKTDAADLTLGQIRKRQKAAMVYRLEHMDDEVIPPSNSRWGGVSRQNA